MCTLPLPLSSGEASNCTATEAEQFDPNLPLQPPSVTVKGRMLSLHTLSSSRKLQLMLCSIGIQRSHLFSLSPQHPLPRSITEFSLKSTLVPREKSQPSRGIAWIMHFVSHKSQYHIFSGIHRPKIHQIGPSTGREAGRFEVSPPRDGLQAQEWPQWTQFNARGGSSAIQARSSNLPVHVSF
jgi:hypothetical protein